MEVGLDVKFLEFYYMNYRREFHKYRGSPMSFTWSAAYQTVEHHWLMTLLVTRVDGHSLLTPKVRSFVIQNMKNIREVGRDDD